MIGRITSAISDRRMPQYLPYAIVKRLLMRVRLENVEIDKIFLALTFDIESNPVRNDDSASIFLRKIRRMNRTPTFFVQGDMVDELSEYLHRIDGEIGLHGYAHENWDDEKWWVNKYPINLKEKKSLIGKSLKIFRENRIKGPVSFRAPYMVINNETLKLLSRNNFKVDSSQSSYLGTYPVPKRFSRILRMPVTANPIPRIGMKKLPHSYYDIFNLERISTFNKEDIIDFIKTVSFFQKSCGYEPHFVFLAHSWEFMKTKEKRYCTDKNYSLIKRMCSIIENEFDVKYLTMRELGDKLN